MNDFKKLTICRPDDWHVHFRDNNILKAVVAFTARQFARAMVMPNLIRPVKTMSDSIAYRQRILEASPKDIKFNPLMVCYLTDDACSNEIIIGYKEKIFAAVKFYPSGATTNSEFGVTDITQVYSLFEKMSQVGMPLLVHGEVMSEDIDIFDREAIFIEKVLVPLVMRFPELKIVLEHVTTKEAVDFVCEQNSNIGATITAHHMIINRSDMFQGGIRPHLFCLPIAKRESHRIALRKAATSGHQSFFLGTDTAPHLKNTKETACGCAGIFSAPTALEMYAQIFEEEKALDQLESFASHNGANFYGLPINKDKITLERSFTEVPEFVAVSKKERIIPFLAGEKLNWKLAGI